MLSVGTEIGRYTVDGVIGHGGMGVVYRASQASPGRVVALKLLSPDLSTDRRFRERFRREAELQAAIEHPHIVPMYEANDSQHGLYIAMRLVPGPNLKELIRRGELGTARTVTLLRGVAEALDTAHSRGLIHRDVKPANILVVDDHAYLADFGLTKAIGLDSLTKSGQLLGTLDYIAPEQIRGEKTDGRSDIYSLGAVLYECLTSRVPFRRATDVAVIYAHLEQTPPSVRDIRPDLPRAVDGVIRRAMAKRAAERQGTARQLIDQAAIALGQAEHGASRHAPPYRLRSSRSSVAKPAARTARRRTRMLLPMVMVLLTVAGGLLAGESGAPAVGAEPLTQTLGAAGATVDVPRDWSKLAPGSPIPNLFMRDSPSDVPRGAAAATPPHTAGTGVVIGRSPAFGPGLLPGGIHRYANFSGTGVPMHLNRIDALFYGTGITRDGKRRIELFQVPTANNVVTIACYGPAHGQDAAVLEDCGRVAATLQVSGSKTFSLGARPEYTAFLNRVLGKLYTRVRTQLGNLSAARTITSQSAAATRLASAYQSAAAEFTTIQFGTISPAEGGIHYLIRDALRAAGRAYGALANAASRGIRKDFRAAKGEVVSAVNTLGASLDQLTKLGYVIS